MEENYQKMKKYFDDLVEALRERGASVSVTTKYRDYEGADAPPHYKAECWIKGHHKIDIKVDHSFWCDITFEDSDANLNRRKEAGSLSKEFADLFFHAAFYKTKEKYGLPFMVHPDISPKDIDKLGDAKALADRLFAAKSHYEEKWLDPRVQKFQLDIEGRILNSWDEFGRFFE